MTSGSFASGGFFILMFIPTHILILSKLDFFTKLPTSKISADYGLTQFPEI